MRNQQFRLALNHKLSIETYSVLQLPALLLTGYCHSVTVFHQECVTCLEQDVCQWPAPLQQQVNTEQLYL